MSVSVDFPCPITISKALIKASLLPPWFSEPGFMRGWRSAVFKQPRSTVESVKCNYRYVIVHGKMATFIGNKGTVKPVCKDHPWCKAKAVFPYRWPLQRGSSQSSYIATFNNWNNVSKSNCHVIFVFYSTILLWNTKITLKIPSSAIETCCLTSTHWMAKCNQISSSRMICHSFIHSFIYLLIYSFIDLFIHFKAGGVYMFGYHAKWS